MFLAQIEIGKDKYGYFYCQETNDKCRTIVGKNISDVTNYIESVLENELAVIEKSDEDDE